MAQVLVTGGSGNVGRHVVAGLNEQGHQVINFDRNRPRTEQAAEFIQGDIQVLGDLRDAMDGVDHVVHLAAIPHPNADPADHVFHVNVIGTHRVLDSAAKADVKRVVFASSDSTFGFVFGTGEERPQYLPVDESHPVSPADPYGLSKLVGEQACAQHSRKYGLTTIALRYCWVWFPPDYPDVDTLQDNDDLARRTLAAYVDARDVTQAICQSLQADISGYESFMITAADTYLTEPTRDFIARALPDVAELRNPAQFIQNAFQPLISCEKARRVLGYEAKHTWR